MRQSKAIGTIFFTLVYLIIGVVILKYTPQNLINSDYVNYLTLTTGYFIVAGILLISYIVTPMDLFEPIIFVTFLYLMIFSIVPIINIIIGETLFFGKDIMGGAQKATWIFIVSYLAFVFGYYLQREKEPLKKKKSINMETTEDVKREILLISLIFWIFCFLLSLFDLLSSGKNLLYILSIGNTGFIDPSRQISTPLGFVSMFGYSMIPTWMYINAYSKNTILKNVLYVLTLIIFVVRGFRFVIVILIMAPIIYYYIKNNKRPSLLLLCILAMVLLFMIGIIGFMRGDIRSGNEVEWASFDIEFIIEAVKGNFDIYQPFYGMVEVIPEDLGYSYGDQIFVYTLIMFIPRAIWPNKPYSNIDEVLTTSVSRYASNAGIAFPNIGEFYMEFGIFGCIVFMFFFGKLCGWSKRLYKIDKNNVNSLIAYSIILPSFMQLVIRGYTPSNFYLILSLLLPILFIKFKTNKNIR
ncbi:O-antigen polymerase [Neobacillus niacini]|uniref:O-antigen polymerase n=1 Tax=Neobacillus niacini TaxID=86668 RepID=UPI002FFE268F